MDHVGPLRFHLEEILQEVESYNRFAQRMGYPLLSEPKIKEARAIQAEAEAFSLEIPQR